MTLPALLISALIAVWGTGLSAPARPHVDGAMTLIQDVPEHPPEVEPPVRPEKKQIRLPRRNDGNDGRPRRQARTEVLIFGAAQEVARGEVEIVRTNGSVVRRRDLGGLGLAMSTVELGSLMTVPILRARLVRNGIDVTLDRNSVYKPAGLGRSYVRNMVGLPETGECGLRRPVRIGLIDGPVDLGMTRAVGLSIVTHSVLDADRDPASSDHATSLALLVAANGGAESPAGLASGARIYAAEALERSGSTNIMTLDNLIAALDWLVSERVELINLSLAGPRNRVLARAMQGVSERGIVLVAAAGNDGRDDVAFPAADPHVISVTAIDARKRRYRSANIGQEIDFAAPGVDVLIPGPGETRYRSGTSYAAAVVSALVARELAQNPADSAEIANRLSTRAEDLGRPGRDSEFGWGLVLADGC